MNDGFSILRRSQRFERRPTALAARRKSLRKYGQRVQFSVFECLIEPLQWTMMKAKLLQEIDPEQDSLRFYFLGKNWKPRVEHVGAKPAYDPEGPLIV